MAVVCTNLTSGSDSDGNATASAGSITLVANRLYVCAVKHKTQISTEPNLTSLSQTGVTWVQIGSALNPDNAGTSRQKMDLWRTMVSSDTTQTLNFSFGGQNQTFVSWIIDEFTGMDTTGTNGSGAIVQSATGVIASAGPADTVVTATLAAFGSTDNATYGFFGNGNNASSPTVGAGFSLVKYFSEPAGAMDLVTEFKSTNDTTVDVTFSSDVEVGIYGVEIKAAAAGEVIKPNGFMTTNTKFWGFS